jgi:hypothetical protein
MSVHDQDNGTVRYTVKELLAQQAEKVQEVLRGIEALNAKLDTKADRERVHDLANQVAAQSLRITKIDDVGSTPVVELRQAQREMDKRLIALEAEIPMRTRLIEEFRESQSDIESLQTWRNRLIGSGGILAAGVGSNMLRIWFGI